MVVGALPPRQFQLIGGLIDFAARLKSSRDLSMDIKSRYACAPTRESLVGVCVCRCYGYDLAE